ncbi:UNVERIFIED_CONTAM: hypothetical protein FKN15_071038 [Acipenser sinensis]
MVEVRDSETTECTAVIKTGTDNICNDMEKEDVLEIDANKELTRYVTSCDGVRTWDQRKFTNGEPPFILINITEPVNAVRPSFPHEFPSQINLVETECVQTLSCKVLSE